jgi:hypothetical protein
MLLNGERLPGYCNLTQVDLLGKAGRKKYLLLLFVFATFCPKSNCQSNQIFLLTLTLLFPDREKGG